MKPSPSRSPHASSHAERGLDRRPELEHGGDVAGSLEVFAGEHDEERRRVDAAVVAAERDLVQFRHFAEARLVQDLAGLGVGGGIDRRRLDAGEVAQHAAGDARVEPQGFERGDQRVAAEGGREPGDAGVGVRAGGGVGHQHVEVGDRAAHRLVEHFVRRSDGGGTRRAGAQRAARLAEAGEEGGARGAGAVAGAAADFEEHGLTGDRGKRQVELCEVAGDTGRGGLEVQAGLAQAVVEAGVGEASRRRRRPRPGAGGRGGDARSRGPRRCRRSRRRSRCGCGTGARRCRSSRMPAARRRGSSTGSGCGGCAAGPAGPGRRIRGRRSRGWSGRRPERRCRRGPSSSGASGGGRRRSDRGATGGGCRGGRCPRGCRGRRGRRRCGRRPRRCRRASACAGGAPATRR